MQRNVPYGTKRNQRERVFVAVALLGGLYGCRGTSQHGPTTNKR